MYMVYDFDGVKVYENISSADFGTMTAFLTSILFFLFTVVCGFIVVLTVLNRILKIYMIAPFAGVALSTLAAGTGGIFLYSDFLWICVFRIINRRSDCDQWKFY